MDFLHIAIMVVAVLANAFFVFHLVWKSVGPPSTTFISLAIYFISLVIFAYVITEIVSLDMSIEVLTLFSGVVGYIIALSYKTIIERNQLKKKS